MKDGILRFVNRGKLYIEEQLNAANEMAQIVAETSKISKVDAIKIGLALFASSVPAMAQTSDPWENFYDLTKSWIQGNLGKFVALTVFIVGLIMSAMTHSARPIVFALILAVIIGGAIGLVSLFFSAGNNSFQPQSGW